MRWAAGLAAHAPSNAPARCRQRLARWRIEWGCFTLTAETLCHNPVRAMARPHVVHHRCIPICHFSPCPVPAPEAQFHRFIAFVGVQIGVAAPTQTWAVQFNLNPRARGDRPPSVSTCMVQRCRKAAQALRLYGHTASHTHGNGHIDFINVDGQDLAIPSQAARANTVIVGVTVDVLAAAFGHGPASPPFAIKRNIECAKIIRISHAVVTGTGQGIVGRKNAADKGDDGQAVLSVVTQRVDIPPEITTRRDWLVESRCAISVAAASRPDMAAIGTPGPGCTLPPAR